MARKISEIGEDGLIDFIFKIIKESEYDDAITESLKGIGNKKLLVTNSDMLVSTTDVPSQMSLFQAGRKAIIMAVSDLLVKGVQPSWASIALGLPNELEFEGDNGFVGLIQGLYAGCKEFGIRYRGGDLNTTKEIIISVTVTGYIKPGNFIPRSGAKPGNSVYINGTFGYTGAGLAILLNQVPEQVEIPEAIADKAINSVLNATVSGAEANFLSEKEFASCSCDSSDGLHRTLQAIAKASGVGFDIDFNQLISPEIITFSEITKIPIEKLILGAGEEWIHVFCIKNISKLLLESEIRSKNLEASASQSKQINLQKIGQCTSNPGEIRYFYNGKELKFDRTAIGYSHFS
jgi:thiamine-monophosphate kinase